MPLLRQYEYFIAVAEELSFSKAAERLHMSQPPLSQQIKQLERHLGVTLLNRHSRGVSLTPAGTILLDEARNLLAQNAKIVDIVQRSTQGYMSTVTIGCITSALLGVIPSLIPRIRHELPYLLPNVLELQTAEQFRALQHGRIDVGILRTKHVPTDLLSHPLPREQLLAALPQDHPLSSNSSINLAELADSPFCLYPHHTAPEAYANVITACGNAGFAPQITSEGNGGYAILALVAAGLGVSLVAEAIAHTTVENVSFHPLDPPLAAIPLHIVSKKASTHPHFEDLLSIVDGYATAAEPRWQHKEEPHN